MALSGSFDTTKYNNKKWLRFNWTATQSIANNTSTISWSVVGVGSESGYHMSGPISVTIAGENVYYSATRIQLSDGTAVASGTKTISHANDGTGSFSASIDAAIYTSSVNCTGSGSYTLDTIARAARITGYTSEWYDTYAPQIQYNNPAGTAVQVQACISLTGATDDIAYRNVPSNAGSNTYTFNLTTAEKNVLYSATSGNSRTMYFFIRTKLNGTIIGDLSYKQTTFKLWEPNPTLTICSLYDSNSTTTALTGNNTIFVKGYSNAFWALDTQAQKGASLSSYGANNNGNIYYNSSGTVNKVTSGTFDFFTKDSRGNTNSASLTRTVKNYVDCTVNCACTNPTIDGKVDITIHGKYWKNSFGSVTNALKIGYTIRKNQDAYSFTDYVTSPSDSRVTFNTSTNDYSVTFSSVSLPDFNETNQYTIQARIYDSLHTSYLYSNAPIVKLTPVFSWSGSDFSTKVHTIIDGELEVRNVIYYDTAPWIEADTTEQFFDNLRAWALQYISYHPCSYEGATRISFGGAWKNHSYITGNLTYTKRGVAIMDVVGSYNYVIPYHLFSYNLSSWNTVI